MMGFLGGLVVGKWVSRSQGSILTEMCCGGEFAWTRRHHRFIDGWEGDTSASGSLPSPTSN